MPVFSCRWPNGDLSFASARNKEDAVDLLDEVGDASGAELLVVREFMVHFHLAGNGALELEGFGEVTNEAIGTAYPLLCEAEINPAAPSDRKTTGIIRKAVHAELERLESTVGAPPKTQLGRDIQATTGMPSSKVDRIVEQTGREALQRFEPDKKH